MLKYVVFGLLVASALAVPAPSSSLDCSKEEDTISCLAVKAATTLERASRSAEISLIDGVTFVRETPGEFLNTSIFDIYFFFINLSK